ncbi:MULTISPECIES: 5-formyltetrahydrofolate cyclo-ligase [Allobacillus]|uniref:5-formyltetrahydrofolate cyclo-ligase n=1 Tax=Allobacillus salarius TaxID=1955272 RepID=A0A556PTH9_9BACI|nr:5-formyltetrahydrofolate cyclo-ligase [Allobacillus salarius]TSJ67700.1 5-formyltetrahydrofolate cyclo-ligase [Allobacillus salarius]
MSKHVYRTLSKRLLHHIPRQYKDDCLNSMMVHLQETNLWQEADTVALTIPRNNELNVEEIIKAAWKSGKQVVIPKCFPKKDHHMEFYLYTNKKELENVYLDLYEPKDRREKIVDKDFIDLIIVPGLLFDPKGYRIGYGGGYYDRYLVDYPNSTVSLAMEEQIVQYIPFDDNDIPVDFIITEDRMIHCEIERKKSS